MMDETPRVIVIEQDGIDDDPIKELRSKASLELDREDYDDELDTDEELEELEDESD